MPEPEIDVQLDYVADADLDCPYIRCPAVPRVGDYVVTPSRKTYQVDRVVWDDATKADKLVVRLKVSPVDFAES